MESLRVVLQVFSFRRRQSEIKAELSIRHPPNTIVRAPKRCLNPLKHNSTMHLPSISSLLLLLPLLTPTFASQADQVAMHTENQPTTSSKPTLADLLTLEPSASIFYSYARELEMSSMLSDGRLKLTLLVPTNKAVMALARKPCVSFFLSFGF